MEFPDSIQQRIMENMGTSLLLLDESLMIIYINPACEMLFEISRRKACGKLWTQLVIENQSLTDRMKESVLRGHPFTKREVQLDLSGGRSLTVDCNITPLFVPEAEPNLLVEIQHMERQVQISKEEQLISQNHAVRALVRGMAHEVKNPLGGLRGAAQLLERELDDEQLKEYTRIIISEADRLQELVDRMLGPSALPKKEMINIHEIFERVHNLVRVEAGDSIEIVHDYDPSIPEINADRDQLIQALLNLVRNAIQAMADSGTLTLRTRSKRQYTIGNRRYKLIVLVEVIDTGPGIPKEIQEQIFLPMITGRAEGTGLGLSIAQSLINRHNGLIECTSEPGNTVFKILIPLENNND
ncbi:MAG: nitrogen regulation protein NR(II) [Gammaproteobacteria bacterium]|nr:nitrogen regulation protein NR(II) [Gammaproteobacteria bacterium]